MSRNKKNSPPACHEPVESAPIGGDSVSAVQAMTQGWSQANDANTLSPIELLQNFNKIADAPDAIPRLRRFILDLAVRGKLVAQDPNDEPVSELIKRIAAEKERLVKEKKIKKPKALPEIEADEVPFEIPDGWKWERLGTVTYVVMGSSPPGTTYNKLGAGVPLINGPVEFSEGNFGKTVVNQYTTTPTYMCQKNDFLICVRGSTTGRTNIANFNACIGRGVAAIQPLFKDHFIRLFVSSQSNVFLGLGRGIAFPSISKSQLLNHLTPLPPLAEQKRIVAKVDELMALCDDLQAARQARETQRDRLVAATHHQLNQTNTDLKEAATFTLSTFHLQTARPQDVQALRQTILNLAVRGKLVEQDLKDEPTSELLKRIDAEKERLVKDGKIKKPKALSKIKVDEQSFKIPDSWSYARIGDLASKTGSGSTPRGGKSAYTDEGVMFLRSQNIYNDGLRLNEVAHIPE